MSPESRRLAGALLVILPTVMIGGVSILALLVNDPEYSRNALRRPHVIMPIASNPTPNQRDRQAVERMIAAAANVSATRWASSM